MKYVCCVLVRDVGIIPKIMDDQPMRRMHECRVRFGHCDRLFISTMIYKNASAKRTAIYGSVFQALSLFRRVSTNAIHLLRLPY